MERHYKLGDLVTRVGTDVHVVVEEDDGMGSMIVECVVAPKSRWIKVGERESNLSGRYLPLDAVPGLAERAQHLRS